MEEIEPATYAAMSAAGSSRDGKRAACDSGGSISLTSGVHEMQPGSIEGLQLVVDDADAAREGLMARGVDVSEVQQFPWGRFVFFSDPDGNAWSVQQLPPRP
jgi:uncharacterized glyoxalase superfamily protein PhnB